ncbi:MAG: replicative DNA helicase [Gammaproteobacteria bacterium]|nr:MAG: replicative DNA helicase [Gammaproteobacteria bacterium]
MSLSRTSQNPDTLRIPPHSVEAEQAVLGGLMLDNECWTDISDQLTEDDFYRHEHRLIFAATAALSRKHTPFDVVTLSEYLEQSGKLEEAGGLAYLGTLARDTPSAANIAAYAKIVREHSVLRQLIHVGTEISNHAFNPENREISELLDEAERQVLEISNLAQKGKHSFQQIDQVLTHLAQKIDDLSQQDSPITGLETGFADLDQLTAGLQKSDLIIVAGRPAMGKTSFAMNIAEHACIHGKKAVAIFSMEMPEDQIALRMVSSIGRIDQHKLRTGKLHDDDWPKVSEAMGYLSESQLFIDDSAALTPMEVRARARRLARDVDLSLIVIDYLQLMQVPGMRDNRVNEISEISRSLKALARELDVPVIALSQLNRGLEQRPNKRPVMSDLRESGAIEQDADLIMFIYRDEVYNEDSPDKGIAEIIVGKHRNGPIGTRRLTFLGQYTRFENFAQSQEYDGVVFG